MCFLNFFSLLLQIFQFNVKIKSSLQNIKLVTMGDNDLYICVQTAAPLFPGCNVSHDLTHSQSISSGLSTGNTISTFCTSVLRTSTT